MLTVFCECVNSVSSTVNNRQLLDFYLILNFFFFKLRLLLYFVDTI